MRILTWNVNGMRAALRKGFERHIDRLQPDVMLLQEVRALPEQLPDAWREPDEWNVLWHPAEKKGYSGVATFSRTPLKQLGTGIDGADDPEGRVLLAQTDGVDLLNIYLPSGSSSYAAQVKKNRWLEEFTAFGTSLRRRRRPLLLAGDLNIARSEHDIFHWRSNRSTSGFLPHEREWMDALVESGWADVIRERFGERDGPYTWWSNRGQARALDRGWRIDYMLANAAASRRVTDAFVDREAGLEVSDHAPVVIDLEPVE
ncbi:MAG: exodeoxyribonuclease III [Phycisphaerales bacterium]|nr:exodeoxyribonuclease III [Phycisphaerales bacterium]